MDIQDFRFAVAQYAQAALRDVVGGLTLDELLSDILFPAQVGELLQRLIDKPAKA